MSKPSSRRTALVLMAILAISSCGGDDGSDDGTNDMAVDASAVTEVSVVAETEGEADEPQVDIPTEIPTELVITDVTEGTGEPAATGDTVFVYYVGVLSADGTRFDGNFGGDPFPVTLGSGSVISGWEEGLVGIKAGGRRQLDIPADLAYGDMGAGDIIGPGDAISFIVDALAVVKPVDPADEPTIDLEPTDKIATELVSTDLVEGTGDEAEAGSTVAVNIIAFNAATGEKLESTWSSPQLATFTLEEGGTLPGLIEGIPGMKVGGRRQLTIPFLDAFGEEGNQDLGLPARTDLVLVIDLVAAFSR